MNKEGARLLRKSLYILLAITLCACTGLYGEAKYQMFSSFIVSDMNEQDKENYIEVLHDGMLNKEEEIVFPKKKYKVNKTDRYYNMHLI